MMDSALNEADLENASISSLADKLDKMQHGLLAIRLELDSHMAVLQKDLVIRNNTVVMIDGRGRTIKTGGHQVLLSQGGRLCLYDLHLIDGTARSPLFGLPSFLPASSLPSRP